MRALVIGGAGQDGVLVSAQLLSDEHEVISISRRPSPLSGVQSEIADIKVEGVTSSLVEKHRPDRIYFLAAYHRSSEAKDPEPADDLLGCLRLNAIAFAETLGSARKHCPHSRTVYASSCRIFGEGNGSLLDESAPRIPVCAYGISKVAGMGAAELFRQEHGLFVSSAILFNHESELRTSNFVSKKLALAALRAKADPSFIVTVGSLDAVADWGSARDYCQGMTAMLEAGQPGDFVLASGKLRTVRDFASEAFTSVGLDWKAHVKEDPAASGGRVWRLIGDSSQLKKHTGWSPHYDFSDMVRDLVKKTEAEEKNGQRSADFHSYL
jgi:GDPmannose 4,6-dehydratase